MRKRHVDGFRARHLPPRAPNIHHLARGADDIIDPRGRHVASSSIETQQPRLAFELAVGDAVPLRRGRRRRAYILRLWVVARSKSEGYKLWRRLQMDSCEENRGQAASGAAKAVTAAIRKHDPTKPGGPHADQSSVHS